MLWIIYSIFGVQQTSFRWEKLTEYCRLGAIISARLVFCFGFLLPRIGMTQAAVKRTKKRATLYCNISA